MPGEVRSRPCPREAAHPVGQEPLAFQREDALGMKLHALDGEGLVAKAHDFAFGGPRADFEAVGQALLFDEERVVTGGLERAGDPLEQRASVVLDGRYLAVHQPSRANDVAAECLSDGLMTE